MSLLEALHPRRAVATCLLAFACGTGSEGSDSLGDDTDDAPACTPGVEGCACNAGACAGGLLCIADVCEPDEGGDGAAEDGSADGESGSDGEGDGCVENDDCDVSEICLFESCTPVGAVDWEFTVTEFTPMGCGDGWGGAEIYYEYYEAGELVTTSATSGCPSMWTDVEAYEPGSDFRLKMYELDFAFDDFFTELCWSEGPDPTACGPVPDEVLHDGQFEGTTGDGAYAFVLVFSPAVN